jgi:TPR repeat protein
MKRARTTVATMAISVLLFPLVSGAAALMPTPPRDTGPGAAQPSAPAPGLAPAPDVIEALNSAAAAGNADAMNDLGVLYSFGVQVPRNYSTAIYWYQKAADRGCAEAMNNLGIMHLYGVGLPRDNVIAFHWFQRAAEGGDPHGMYSVAVMADIGLGTPRDPALGRAMYRKAAEAGFAPAMVRVSDEYTRGPAGSHDLVEAYAWLQVALQTGVPEELQIEVLSRLDTLATRLGAARREQARTRAVHLAAFVKAHAPPARTEATESVDTVPSDFM